MYREQQADFEARSNKDILDYFDNLDYHLNKADKKRQKEFSSAMKALKGSGLSAENLINILTNTRNQIDGVNQDDKNCSIRKLWAENMHLWDDAICSQMNKLRPNKFAQITQPFAAMRIAPNEKFVRIWESAFKKRISQMDMKALADSCMSCAKLGIVLSDDTIEEIKLRVNQHMRKDGHHIENRDKRSITWSMATMDAIAQDRGHHNPNFKEIAKKIMPYIENPKTPMGEGQIFQTCFWFDFNKFQDPPKESKGKSLEENNLRAIFMRLSQQKDAKFKVTKTPRRVFSLLGHKVDIPIQYQESESDDPSDIMFEYDGIHHFLYGIKPDGEFGPVSYDGSTIHSSMQIKKAHPNSILVRIPYFVDELIPQKYKAAFLNLMLTKAIKNQHGMYDTRYTPGNADTPASLGVEHLTNEF